MELTSALGRLLKPLDREEMLARFERVLAIAYLQVWSITVLVAVALVGLQPSDTPLVGVVVALILLHALNLTCLLSRRSHQLAVLVACKFTGTLVFLTVLIHFLGWSRSLLMMIAPYVIVLVNAQLVVSTTGRFLMANVVAAGLALLLAAEETGFLAKYPPILFGPPDDRWWAWVVGVSSWASLNFTVLHATLFPSMFETRSAELARANERLDAQRLELAEKAAQLANANEGLWERARALAVKQEELRSFAYIVTHDLKNPVNAILLLSDRLLGRDGPRLSPDGCADLERIIRLASSTEGMLRDLLGLFQAISIRESPGWVDLDELVRNALDDLRPHVVAKRLQVLRGPLPRVWGHAEKLGHVVSNLLSNAVKYVPAEGGRVEVSGGVEDGEALLCVGDNGIGIPKDYHDAIFRLFGRVPVREQQVDGRVVAGSGVGLAIVKRIVEMHRGTVWVESESGTGSRFYVRLPVAEGDRKAA